jgi:hypothetical protein
VRDRGIAGGGWRGRGERLSKSVGNNPFRPAALLSTPLAAAVAGRGSQGRRSLVRVRF